MYMHASRPKDYSKFDDIFFLQFVNVRNLYRKKKIGECTKQKDGGRFAGSGCIYMAWFIFPSSFLLHFFRIVLKPPDAFSFNTNNRTIQTVICLEVLSNSETGAQLSWSGTEPRKTFRNLYFALTYFTQQVILFFYCRMQFRICSIARFLKRLFSVAFFIWI